MADMVFKNKKGEVYDHIGSEVEVLEAAGMRELGWYRSLPQPADVRFHIDAQRVIGGLQEPAILAKFQALLNRGETSQSMTVNMQLAIDLIFGDQAADMIDERRMCLFLMLVHNLAQQLGTNMLKRRLGPLAEMMGHGLDDISILGLGPDGLEELFGGNSSLDSLPTEVREMIRAWTRGRRSISTGEGSPRSSDARMGG